MDKKAKMSFLLGSMVTYPEAGVSGFFVGSFRCFLFLRKKSSFKVGVVNTLGKKNLISSSLS